MKKLFIPFLFIFSCTFGQETISEVTTADQKEGRYYLKTIKVISNESLVPDTVTEVTYIGDSLQAINFIINQVADHTNLIERIYSRLFEVISKNEIGKLNNSFLEITGNNIYAGLSERFNNAYTGVYRVIDGNSNYFADAAINANGVLVLTDRNNASNKLIIRPLNNNSFLITNHSSGQIKMYNNGIKYPDGRKLFFSEKRLIGDNSLRIVFLRPVSQTTDF